MCEDSTFPAVQALLLPSFLLYELQVSSINSWQTALLWLVCPMLHIL